MKTNIFKIAFLVLSCSLFLQVNGQTWNPNAPAYTVVYTAQQKAAQRALATQAISELALAGSSYTFSPGVYRFSNGSRFINLYGRSNFTLIASGCTFIQENITAELFFVQNATNISIIGPLTIESDPLGYSQAKVTAIGPNSISFAVMKGYPTPKSPASGQTKRFMVFDQNGVWKSPSPNSQWPFLTYSAFSGNNKSGTITTSSTGSDMVQVGDYISIGEGEGLGTLLDVNGMTLQDITIHTGCTGLISWGGGTGDWHYTRVKAIPKPGTSQLIGGSGPQHSFGLGSNVYFDGCEFIGSTDDNLNVFSNDAAYFEMKNCKWTNSTVRVMAQGFRKVSITNNIFTRIGQGLGVTMDQVNWNEGNPCYDATISDNTFIQTPYVTYWDYGAIHYGPMTGTDRFTNVNIARNTISNGKGRGIYVNNTDSGQISNNVITGMTGAAITLNNCTNITTPNCTPDPIFPQTQINGGEWVSTGVPTLAAGGTVWFGPGPGWLPGSWSWTGPNGFTASERAPLLTNVQPNQSGDYVVTFINEGGCLSQYTFTLTVTGQCIPDAIFPQTQINGGEWVSTGVPTLAAGGTVWFGPGPGWLPGSWSWIGPNGFTASERAPLLTNVQPNQSGDYVVTFINAGGCLSQYTYNLTVTGGTTPSLIKTSNTIINSKNNMVDLGLGFFPNPAINFINVKNAKGADISIFDSLGKVVLKSNCADDLTRIDLTGLFNGFYMIQAQKGKEIATQKLVITK